MDESDHDKIYKFALSLAKHHYEKQYIYHFYLKINLPNIYENNQERTAVSAYYKAIIAWRNSKGVEFDIEKELVKKLRELEWNSTADEILEIVKCLSGNAEMWNPPEKVQFFTGREKYFTEINKYLKDGSNAQVSSYVGMGGIGKTSLVSEYVYNNIAKYKRIIWFNSDSNDHLLKKEFLEFGKKIIDPRNEEIEKIVKWFEKDENHGWLIVFDNVENSESIKKYMPKIGGKILITSRYNCFQNEGTIELGKFELSDVKKFIEKVIPDFLMGESEETVERFAEQLEFHPLAIKQAVFYMKEVKITIKVYLEIIEEETKKLLNTLSDEIKLNNSIIENYMTLFTTFMISVRKVHEKCREAFNVLNQCAYFSPQNIPKILFKRDELKILQDYSLITLEWGNYFFIHRLVQESLLFKITGNDANTEDQKMYLNNNSLEVLEAAYKSIDNCYPLGRVTEENLILKSDLLSHYYSLNIHNKRINGVSQMKNDLTRRYKTKNYNFRPTFSQRKNAYFQSSIKKFKDYSYEERPENTIVNALKYFELSCEKSDFDNIVENLKKSLEIFQIILKNDHHEIIMEIYCLLSFQYRQKWYNEDFDEKYKSEADNIAKRIQSNSITRYNLARSYYLETREIGNDLKKSEKFSSYSDAYNIQYNLWRKGY